MTKPLYVLGAVGLILVTLYLSITIPAFSIATYKTHYQTAHTSQIIQIEETELIHVTQHLINYMRGKAPDLEVWATVGGVYRPFFTQREVDHMADVIVLFNGGRILAGLSAVCAIAALGVAYKKKQMHTLSAVTLVVIAAVVALIIWLVIAFTRDFVGSWWLFHHIFFFNDADQLWILDPTVDHLVNMVPYEFFMSLLTTIATNFVVSLGVVIATCTTIVSLHKRKHRN